MLLRLAYPSDMGRSGQPAAASTPARASGKPRKLKVYFWNGFRFDETKGKRVDSSEMCAAASKAELQRITDTVNRPSDLFNLNIIDPEKRLTPEMELALANPGVVFWKDRLDFGAEYVRAEQ